MPSLLFLASVATASAQQWSGYSPAGSAVVDNRLFVASGTAGATSGYTGGSYFSCVWASPNGTVPGQVIGTAGLGFAPGCSVAVNKGVVVGSPSLILTGDVRLGWWGGATPTPPSPDLAFVLAGSYGGTPGYVCRGRSTSFPNQGLVPGVTSLATQVYTGFGDVGVVCLVPLSSKVLATFSPGSPLASLGTFEYLLAAPPGASAATYAPLGVTPAIIPGPSSTPTASPSPSPTLTPSVTPTPSPSGSAVPFYGALWVPLSQASTITKTLAGRENNPPFFTPIFVCAGFIPSTTSSDPAAPMDILPGKYEDNFGKCNIAFNNTEFSDPLFLLLRSSPWLMWSTATPPTPATPANMPFNPPASGLQPLNEGSYKGTPLYVCRGWFTLSYPPYGSGPHSGFTNGSAVGDGGGGSGPVCTFSYGSVPVSVRAFDVLWLAPGTLGALAAGNLSATLPVTPPPGASASNTPSFSRTPSLTPSASPSPFPAGAQNWVSVPSSSAVSGAPSRYVLGGVDTDGFSPTALCRGSVTPPSSGGGGGGGALILPGSYNSRLAACYIPLYPTLATASSSSYGALAVSGVQVLMAQPYLAWATPALVASQMIPMTLVPVFDPLNPPYTPPGGTPSPSSSLFNSTSRSSSPTPTLTPTSSPTSLLPPNFICRAFHPVTRAGPYTGSYNASLLFSTDPSLTPGSPTPCPALNGTLSPLCTPGCLISTVSFAPPVVATSSFQLLYLLPSSLTIAQAQAWSNASNSLFVPPSPSPSPTPSPTPSSSMAPAIPGVLQWIPGPASRYPSFPNAWRAGTEDKNVLYVCRAFNYSLNEVIPGKTWPGANFCDVALRGKELPDIAYEILRWNPSLAWVPRVANGTGGCGGGWGKPPISPVCAPAVLVPPPPGTTPVVAGVVDELPAQPCRAYHPVAGSGPHSGYTDGQVYNGIPLCFFSYDGGIVRTAPFDVLVTLASPNTATATLTPSSSRTPPPTPLSITSTTTLSATPTPSRSGSPTPPTPTPTPSQTPTLGTSPSPTPSQTPTPSPSLTSSPSITSSPSLSSSTSPSGSNTPSGSSSPSPSLSPSPTASVGAVEGASSGGNGNGNKNAAQGGNDTSLAAGVGVGSLALLVGGYFYYQHVRKGGSPTLGLFDSKPRGSQKLDEDGGGGGSSSSSSSSSSSKSGEDERWGGKPSVVVGGVNSNTNSSSSSSGAEAKGRGRGGGDAIPLTQQAQQVASPPGTILASTDFDF